MQWIDFYLDEYKPKPMTFDSRFAMIAMAGVVIITLIFGVWQQIEQSKFDQLVAQKQQQVSQIEQQINAMSASLNNLHGDDNARQNLTTKREELKNLNLIVSRLQKREATQAIAYSQIMQQLSEQTINQLWLTRIQLEEGRLSLQGATTNREAIPGYIEQIQQASALQREFASLSVEKDSENRRIVHFKLNAGVSTHGG